MKKVPVKAHIKKKKSGGVSTVKASSRTIKKEAKKKSHVRKTAYSNDEYTVLNKVIGGEPKYFVIDKNGKTVATSSKPTVLKSFLAEKSPDDFFGRQMHEGKKKARKIKDSRRGKTIGGAVERAAREFFNPTNTRVGREKELPANVQSKLPKKRRVRIPKPERKLHPMSI